MSNFYTVDQYIYSNIELARRLISDIIAIITDSRSFVYLDEWKEATRSQRKKIKRFVYPQTV